MDINDLIAMVTEGLTDEQAIPVKAAILRDNVKAKASTIKAQSEFEAIEGKRAALEAELQGGPEKPGAKAYREWYEKNFPQVEANSKAIENYDKKYGPGAFAAAVAQGGTVPQGTGKSYTDEDIQRIVDSRFQTGYAPKVGNIMSSSIKILQKHFLAGRKTEIDIDKLTNLAESKYSGNLEQAYDEYDKPEREAADKTQREAEIDRRVKEELQKRGASQHFPAGADLTPGALSGRSKSEVDKFDRNALDQDLVNAFMGASEGGVQ